MIWTVKLKHHEAHELTNAHIEAASGEEALSRARGMYPGALILSFQKEDVQEMPSEDNPFIPAFLQDP